MNKKKHMQMRRNKIVLNVGLSVEEAASSRLSHQTEAWRRRPLQALKFMIRPTKACGDCSLKSENNGGPKCHLKQLSSRLVLSLEVNPAVSGFGAVKSHSSITPQPPWCLHSWSLSKETGPENCSSASLVKRSPLTSSGALATARWTLRPSPCDTAWMCPPLSHAQIQCCS